MHPEIVAVDPGSCPVCGMDLVTRAVEAGPPVRVKDGLPEVTVAPEFVHNFGVRTAPVTLGPVSRRIEAIGRVARMPQPRLTEIRPGLAGKLSSVNAKTVGDRVADGELLFTLDSPDWRHLQQRYLAALDGADMSRVNQLGQNLRGLGMNEESLLRLQASRTIDETLQVFAPQEGAVVECRAHHGSLHPRA